MYEDASVRPRLNHSWKDKSRIERWKIMSWVLKKTISDHKKVFYKPSNSMFGIIGQSVLCAQTACSEYSDYLFKSLRQRITNRIIVCYAISKSHFRNFQQAVSPVCINSTWYDFAHKISQNVGGLHSCAGRY